MCKGDTRKERLDNAVRQVTYSKESARDFLYKAGITTKQGTLKTMFQ